MVSKIPARRTFSVTTVFVLSTFVSIVFATSLHAQQEGSGSRAKPALSAGALLTYQDIQQTLGFVPDFLRLFPEEAIAGAWEVMKTVQLNPDTAIPPKYKELIGAAAAAQIPCTYCSYFHKQAAKLTGGTEDEIREAIALAALTRQWSTFLQGAQISPEVFREDVNQMMNYLSEQRENGTQLGARAESLPGEDSESETKTGAGAEAEADSDSEAADQKSKNHNGEAAGKSPQLLSPLHMTYQEIQSTVGIVPEFLRKYPPAAVPGAWKEIRGLLLDPQTKIPRKYKHLIGLAVAAQIPCPNSVYFYTRAAKLEGASEAELRGAAAMSSVMRHWSTVLNGLQIEPAEFKRETARMMRFLRQKQMTQEQKAGVSPRNTQ